MLALICQRMVFTIEVRADKVSHPKHYNSGSIETIDYIQSVLGNDGCYDFCIGNVIKYISRAKFKGTWAEDLEKATWYLEKAKSFIEAN